MNTPIKKTVRTLALGLAAVALATAYWQLVASSRLQQDPRNERLPRAEAIQDRGSIISADGTVLGRSVPDSANAGHHRRSYPQGALFAPVVGFSSPTYGDQGLEAEYASMLRPDGILTVGGLVNALLGEDLRPHSLQLTLHRGLQVETASALGSQRGGITVLDPATGMILAMVSAPTFDPNRLFDPDADSVWADLTRDPDRPLENRAAGASTPGLVQDAPLESIDPSSPLGMAVRVGAFTRGGTPMRPHLVKRVLDADSKVVEEITQEPMDEEVDYVEVRTLYGAPSVFELNRLDTGRVSGLGIAGAERGAGDVGHAWFVGGLPGRDPAVVVAVVIELDSADSTDRATKIGMSVLRSWVAMVQPTCQLPRAGC